jgi:hypothetical protein
MKRRSPCLKEEVKQSRGLEGAIDSRADHPTSRIDSQCGALSRQSQLQDSFAAHTKVAVPFLLAGELEADWLRGEPENILQDAILMPLHGAIY